MMAKKREPEPDEPEDRFADVFHSFKDLHNVSPSQFLARLERKGVIVAWKAKRRRAAVVGGPHE
ncbi:hypothetical protein IVB34_12540 [Bradyrhizobium sp. 2]|uniref:hypothetical protein n=1 Tax=Bradyrhizobium sp. 2 TaxID=190045 RepID=UPI001FFA3B40|nr:hypothetical protein [Bradyrhizobium sp. 2]MCK1459117.1 hypothetical protein [Bradyrhizobium sp. 2]MCK1459183.1 hypothetical protein [Bradyrhizobium sp. 2]